MVATRADATRHELGSAGIVFAGDTVEVGRSAWAELRLVDDVIIRSSAGTRLAVGSGKPTAAEPAIALRSGRAWVEVPERPGPPFSMRAGRVLVTVPPGGSVIVEVSASTGPWIVVRRETVRAASNAIQVDIEPGWLGNFGGDGVVRPGGRAIADLVAMEARGRIGDLIGLEAFLIRHSGTAALGRTDARRVRSLLRLDPEATGADAGYAGALIEESVRPAPFFEEEVPPKGPNVRVEIEFAGD